MFGLAARKGASGKKQGDCTEKGEGVKACKPIARLYSCKLISLSSAFDLLQCCSVTLQVIPVYATLLLSCPLACLTQAKCRKDQCVTPIELHQTLSSHFDEEELQTLCFALQVDYQSLPTVGKSNKARELLLLLARMGRLNDLLIVLGELRPQVVWPPPEEATALAQAMQLEWVASTPATPTVVLNAGSGAMTVNAPFNVAWGNLTINPEVPLWQRLLPLALLPVLLLILVGVWLLIRPMFSPSVRPPIAEDLLPVAAAFSLDWEITTLHLTQIGSNEVLWFGVQQNGQSILYRLDVAERDKAVPQPFLQVEARINEIMVDCRQNVWLALDETGVLVYQPATDRQETLLNRATTSGWMNYNTMATLAHRCADNGEVEVWFGRDSIYTLRYQSAYPTLDTLLFTPRDAGDPIFRASQNMFVTDLVFVPETAVLWVAGLSGELLSISARQVRPPQSQTYDDTVWSLSLSPDGQVWAGSSRYLIVNGESLPIISAEGRTPDSRAYHLAATVDWTWFGDRCSEFAIECWVLGVYGNSRFFPVDLDKNHAVTGLAVDSQNGVWIGTKNGLLLYP